MTFPRDAIADQIAAELGHSFEGEIRIGGHAASDLLYRVFGEAGVHTRTSIGVYSLPKNASVELDMVVSTYGD